MTPPKILPPHYFLLSVVLMVVVSQFTVGQILGGGVYYLGVLPMLVGAIIAAYASNQFKRAATNIVPLTKSTTLVSNGLFRYSRNPMYLGMMMFLIGLGIVTASPWSTLIVCAFALLIRQQFVLQEEQLMLNTFAKEYLTYTKQVRRWF